MTGGYFMHCLCMFFILVKHQNVTGGSLSTSAEIGPSASATRVPSQPVFKIDESQPVTTLQIRLADGTR